MKVILLDTNAYSELFKGRVAVQELMDSSDLVLLSIFVIAELLSGFKIGNREKSNLKLLNNFVSNPKVKIIQTSMETAKYFSELKHYLRLKGKPIPINDIWIAAHTLEYQANLITNDKHFLVIPDIKIHNIIK